MQLPLADRFETDAAWHLVALAVHSLSLVLSSTYLHKEVHGVLALTGG